MILKLGTEDGLLSPSELSMRLRGDEGERSYSSHADVIHWRRAHSSGLVGRWGDAIAALMPAELPLREIRVSIRFDNDEPSLLGSGADIRAMFIAFGEALLAEVLRRADNNDCPLEICAAFSVRRLQNGEYGFTAKPELSIKAKDGRTSLWPSAAMRSFATQAQLWLGGSIHAKFVFTAGDSAHAKAALAQRRGQIKACV